MKKGKCQLNVRWHLAQPNTHCRPDDKSKQHLTLIPWALCCKKSLHSSGKDFPQVFGAWLQGRGSTYFWPYSSSTKNVATTPLLWLHHTCVAPFNVLSVGGAQFTYILARVNPLQYFTVVASGLGSDATSGCIRVDLGLRHHAHAYYVVLYMFSERPKEQVTCWKNEIYVQQPHKYTTATNAVITNVCFISPPVKYSKSSLNVSFSNTPETCTSTAAKYSCTSARSGHFLCFAVFSKVLVIVYMVLCFCITNL